MTIKGYKELVKPKKPSKYKNKKTTRIRNNKVIKFDSLKEARYYDTLALLERTEKITKLELQPKYNLIPTQKYNGKTLRKTTYSADFRYVKDGKTYVIDVKGFKTDVYKIKKKLFLQLYGERIIFEEVY